MSFLVFYLFLPPLCSLFLSTLIFPLPLLSFIFLFFTSALFSLLLSLFQFRLIWAFRSFFLLLKFSIFLIGRVYSGENGRQQNVLSFPITGRCNFAVCLTFFIFFSFNSRVFRAVSQEHFIFCSSFSLVFVFWFSLLAYNPNWALNVFLNGSIDLYTLLCSI